MTRQKAIDPAPPPPAAPIAGPVRLWLARRILPVFTSLAVHAGLIALVAFISAGITSSSPGRRPPDLAEVDLTPFAQITDRPEAAPSPAPPARPSAPPQPPLADSAAQVAQRAINAARASDPGPAPRPIDPAPGPSAAPANLTAAVALPPPQPAGSIALPARPGASYAGLRPAQAARDIVYCVDVSGSMVTSIRYVLEELLRSIDRLQPTQRFQVVVFARTGDDDRLSPPALKPPLPTDRDGYLRPIPKTKLDLRRWLDTIHVGGRPAPVEGLDLALALSPDLVFLLSRSIERPGPGPAWGGGRDRILAALDSLNPLDPRTGRRPTVIKTVQFIDPDPTAALEAIARAHGDGAQGHRTITLEELRAPPDQPAPPAPPPALIAQADPFDAPADPQINSAVARASARLDPVTRAGADLIALLGLPTPAESAAVFAAASAALAELPELTQMADASPQPQANPTTSQPPTPPLDPRPALLRGRLLALLAATDPDPATRAERAAQAALAVADLGVLTPQATADRALTLASAQRLASRPAAARQTALAILADASDLGLGPDMTARLAASAVLADAAAGSSPRTASSHAPPQEASRFDRLLHAQAVARVALEAAAPLQSPAASLAALGATQDRLATLFDRARASRGEPALDGVDPALVRGYAAHLASAGARGDEALAVLLHAASADLEARLAAAALLESSGKSQQAGLAYLNFADAAPQDPRAPDALARGLALTAPPMATPTPPSSPRQARLQAAVTAHPAHPASAAWRLELAAIRRDPQALALLDAIPQGPLRASADELRLAIADEIAALEPTDPAALDRAARAAQAAGDPSAPARWLRLANALLVADPARAASVAASIPGDHADLLEAKAHQLAQRPDMAFQLAGSLADRLEARGDITPLFWEAWALRLELLTRHGGPTGPELARRAVIRLSLIDPALGGDPWAARFAPIRADPIPTTPPTAPPTTPTTTPPGPP